MRCRSLVFVSVVAFLIAPRTVGALTVAYGARDMLAAGAGCVGGYVSEHGNTAYFRGDTERLNEQLRSLVASDTKHRSVKVVLHAGEKVVDNPDEQPLIGFDDDEVKQLTIDWSVRETCPAEGVLSGHCMCERRNVTVDVWIANDIRLDDLSIPPRVEVEAGREIEQFIDRHRQRR